MTVEQCAKLNSTSWDSMPLMPPFPVLAPWTHVLAPSQGQPLTYLFCLYGQPALPVQRPQCAPVAVSGTAWQVPCRTGIRCAAAACHPLCMQPRWHASSAPYPRLAPEAPPAVSTADDASQLVPQLFLQRIWYTGSSLEWAHAEPPRRLLCRRLVPAGRPDYLHQTQKYLSGAQTKLRRGQRRGWTWGWGAKNIANCDVLVQRCCQICHC